MGITSQQNYGDVIISTQAHSLKADEHSVTNSNKRVIPDEPMYWNFKNGFPEIRPDDNIEPGWYVPGVVDPAHYPDDYDQELSSEELQELLAELRFRLGDVDDSLKGVTGDNQDPAAESAKSTSESAARIAMRSVLAALLSRRTSNASIKDDGHIATAPEASSHSQLSRTIPHAGEDLANGSPIIHIRTSHSSAGKQRGAFERARRNSLPS